MKQSIRVLFFVLAISATLLSACGGASVVASPSGAKVEAVDVAFTGVIEAMNGTQWVVNGQTITIDPALVQNGSFKVGDTVKVEAKVGADGSVTITSVEVPSSTDLLQASVIETPSGTPGSSDNGSISILGASQAGGLTLDNSGNEAFGSVDAITPDLVTIGGQIFSIANGAEFKNQIAAGDFVKVHFLLNADGTMSITEIETWDPALVGNDNSNFNDNSNDDNSNDDHGNDTNSNDDDNGRDDNGNGSGGNGNGDD